MFSPADQPHFTLTLAGADVQVVAFKGREALNRPFVFDLELVILLTGERLSRPLEMPLLTPVRPKLPSFRSMKFRSKMSGATFPPLMPGCKTSAAGRLPLNDCNTLQAWC